MIENKSLVWDETFPAILLKGEGAFSFLHGQTTADVFAQKQLERVFMSCWLSTKGILKALLEIRLSNNFAEVVILSGDINSIKSEFESVIFPADKVKLEVIKPIRRIQKINFFTSWKSEDSDWIDNNNIDILENAKYNKATIKELEVWKIRQGIPTLKRELNGETNPYELGLGDLINLDKGCYLGQEAIARLSRSKSFKYKLRYWEGYGKCDHFDIGKKIFSNNQDSELKKKVGNITSSIMIDDGFFNGLALIKTNFLEKDLLFSENGDSIIIKQPISFSHNY